MNEKKLRAWREAVFVRRSCRRFDGRPAEPRALARVDEVCEGFHPFGSARAVLVRKAPRNVFKGVVGSYGSVRDAPHCLVMAGPEGAAAEVGYVGQAAVLEATGLGLGTCWVGGMFRPDVAASLVSLAPGERVFAVSPVGRATTAKSLGEKIATAIVRSRTRRPVEEIAPGSGGWPEWARKAVEAARMAPSALNIQPWRFSFRAGAVTLSTDGKKDPFGIPKRLDCGIAMLHFELGAWAAGMHGTWCPTPDHPVAIFSPGNE
jgi:nitroreductase